MRSQRNRSTNIIWALTLLLTPFPIFAVTPSQAVEQIYRRELPMPLELPQSEGEGTFTLPPVKQREPSETSARRAARVLVKEIKYQGNSVISSHEIDTILAIYTGKYLSIEDIYGISQEITETYIERGYINSGAYIPNQDITAGVVQIRIIEGAMGEITLHGNRHLKDQYITSRVARSASDPLNVQKLQDGLLILQQDRLIERLDAELSPSKERGLAALDVNVVERTPYTVSAGLSNAGSPATGSWRLNLDLAHHNLTGWGDSLQAFYSKTDGVDEYYVDYGVPVTARDTRIGLFVNNSDSMVVERPFRDAQIETETDSYGMSVSDPVYRTVTKKLTIGARIQRKETRTFILGEPFAFTPGFNERGRANVANIELFQEWTDRSQEHSVALRSTFIKGVDWFNATVNDTAPDSRYFIWQGQGAYMRRINDQDALVLRGDIRWTNDELLSSEKFGVGGVYSVRGYRQDALVEESGATASVEYLHTLKGWSTSTRKLQAVVFVDAGWVRSTDAVPEVRTHISSVGLGGVFNWKNRFNAALYYGKALQTLDFNETDLQDEGVHVQTTLTWP